MEGRTPNADSELTSIASIRLAAKIFSLGAVRDAIHLVAGQKNENWKVTTESGTYVVRFGRAAQTVSDIEHEQALVAHLRGQGYPAPEFLTTDGGIGWALTADALVTVSRFVDAAGYENLQGQLEAAALALADFHSIVETYRTSAESPTRSSVQDIICERMEHRDIDEVTQGNLLTVVQTVRRLTSGPPSMIHGGSRPSSYLFAGSKIVLVLDFDSARRDHRDLDVSIAVRSFCSGRTTLEEGIEIPLSMKRFRRYRAAFESTSPGATDWYRTVVLAGAWFAKRAFRNDADLPTRAAAAAALVSHAHWVIDND